MYLTQIKILDLLHYGKLIGLMVCYLWFLLGLH